MVDSPTVSDRRELEPLRRRVAALERGMEAVAVRIDTEAHAVSEGFKNQQEFIVKHVSALAQTMEVRFASVDQRFAQFDGRMNTRFTLLDEKIDGVEIRLNDKLARLEVRFDEKLAGLETRFDDKLAGLETRSDDKLAGLGEKIARIESKLDRFIAAQTKFNRLIEARLRPRKR